MCFSSHYGYTCNREDRIYCIKLTNKGPCTNHVDAISGDFDTLPAVSKHEVDSSANIKNY